ncbi:hypothetical protein, partial [Salmonella enterica]|uniref:hypothetical protein n=1 Tax=Salmonella enterica TaxID=28901 RepID=UPI0019D612A3
GGAAAASSAVDADHPRPDPLADPGGAIEHVDPRIARTTDEMAEHDAWLEAHGDEIGLGWALGGGRALERRL